jgi:adenine-specific DNA-methyltransferase
MASSWNANCCKGVREIVVGVAFSGILRFRPMRQMILEFGRSNLTKFKYKHILSSESCYPDKFPASVLTQTRFESIVRQLASTLHMKLQPSYTKLRGGYYTPRVITEFLAKWGICSKNAFILEPSCGDGAFVEAAADRLLRLRATDKQIADQITAYEIDASESAKAFSRLQARGIGKNEEQVHTGDFFAGVKRTLAAEVFDVVLGNPPFIRYQNFPEEQRELAFAIMKLAGLKPNRLTNAWVPFLVGASLSLKARGRLAMVVPAELLQVNYAADLRLFLSNYFTKIRVLTFRKLAFQEVQQEVVLLLAERDSRGKSGIEVVEFEDTSELANYRPATFGENGFRSIDHSTEKWTQYYLSEKEIRFIRELKSHTGLAALGSLADTDVGVVTGMNDFFLLTEEQASEARLKKFTRPSVNRSGHLPGIIFTKQDWRENTRLGYATHMLDLPFVEKPKLPRDVRAYVRSGEVLGLHLGYKCRSRKLWYVVPSIYDPSGFLLRQIHHYPKLVVNEASATCTDTIHRVRFRAGVDGRRVAASFANSLTFAFSEILGRSYGGGVLELEPNEADKIPIPVRGGKCLDPDETDSLLRSGRVEEVLSRNDTLLLKEGLGLSDVEVRTLNNAWKKLRERRIGRKSSRARTLSNMRGKTLISGEVGRLNPLGEGFNAN